MKLTTKGRYAVAALLDLTLQQSPNPVPLADMARRQAISQPYLERIFCQLRQQGLVSSNRGPGGGYTLSRAPEQISIGAIIRSVDENIDARRCNGGCDCNQGMQCITHDLWENLNQAIYQFLDGISLQSLAESIPNHAVATESHLTNQVLMACHSE